MKDKYFNGWEEYFTYSAGVYWFLFPNGRRCYVSNKERKPNEFIVWDKNEVFADEVSKWTVTQILRGIKEEKEWAEHS